MNPDIAPVRVTAFACPFKCGSRVQTKFSRAWEHLKKCFWNPARRACATCVHWVQEPGDPEVGMPYRSFCSKLDRDLTKELFADCEAWGAKP